jgi:pimeloyl-ACP methyl ester carboxylesterase
MPISSLAAATVVLVHGAFADGSSWDKVIERLHAQSIDVIAVQSPSTSLEDDVAATRRAIKSAKGPVILVGHSWGGAVITEAGIDPKVKGLVYVAAFAPDAGMSVNDLGKGAPPLAWQSTAQISSDGYMTLPADSIEHNFAPELPAYEADVIASTQAPIAVRSFDEKISGAAWRDRPNWYVVTTNDRMIAPTEQRAMAATIHAHVTELASSHVAMLTHPDEVAAVIEDAVESVGQREASTR